MRARQRIDPGDHLGGALLIGLDRKPETVPAFQRRIGKRRGDHVERQLQPVGFLGIDGEVQIVALRAACELDQPRHQLRHHAGVAHRLEARMQRGEFDGNAGPFGQGTAARAAADRVDRGGIGIEIALRVLGGARAFAEHVEGIARGGGRMHARQRRLDGFAQHEVAAHQPHRLPRGGAHRGRAEPLGEPADRALRRLAGLDHPRRQAERPGRGIDQEGGGFGLVMDEVAFAELVLDELVGGAGIGHAQQRFRQHHQRQPLLGREREFAQHVLDAAERIVIGPDRLDQAGRDAVDPLLLLGVEPCGRKQTFRDDAIIRGVRCSEWRRGRRHGATVHAGVLSRNRQATKNV